MNVYTEYYFLSDLLALRSSGFMSVHFNGDTSIEVKGIALDYQSINLAYERAVVLPPVVDPWMINIELWTTPQQNKQCYYSLPPLHTIVENAPAPSPGMPSVPMPLSVFAYVV